MKASQYMQEGTTSAPELTNAACPIHTMKRYIFDVFIRNQYPH